MGTQGILSTGSSQPEDILVAAGRKVDQCLQHDTSYPQLVEQLQVGTQLPSVSGLNDYDYPLPMASSHGVNMQTRRVPLPAELVEQFGHMQCNCMMGLFPEIGRAWLTIDSDLFVWTYDNAGDLAYFNGLNETILSVSLVRPKPGIFRQHIQFLLCLATPLEIVLLGVSFGQPGEEGPINYLSCEMHLLTEPLFFLPSDNCFLMTAVGTESGRIFLGGRNGCLYEFVYQAEEGWFSRKCRKVNHSSSSLAFLVPSFLNFAFSEEDPLVQIAVDNTRNILYTRSEKGTIQVFDLGYDGKSMSKVTAMSQASVTNHAVSVARTIDRSTFKKIVHIAPVESRESPHIHLVAVTQSGVRLYFTTAPFSHPLNCPSTLQLLHVRLPPGYAASAPPERPSKVHLAHYKKGTLLLVNGHSDDRDEVWAITGDAFPFHPQLMETQTLLALDGKVWCMTEVPQRPVTAIPTRRDGPVQDPPLVVTQHLQVPRQFVLLTPQGSHILTQLRPVDQLRQLLLDCHGPDGDPVKGFFTLQPCDQACAACLILACSQVPQDTQVAEWAARAFFLYGGEPSLPGPATATPVVSAANVGYNLPAVQQSSSFYPAFQSPSMNVTSFQPPQASTPNLASPQLAIPYGYHSPSTPSSPLPITQSVSSPQFPAQQSSFSQSDVQFSGKHNGLYLYLGRILRPLWETPLVQERPLQLAEGHVRYLSSVISSDEVDWFQQQLAALRDFLDKYSHAKQIMSGDSSNLTSRGRTLLRHEGMSSGDVSQMHQQLHKKSQVEALLQEKSSIHLLQQLLNRVWEVLGLWKVLVDHQFHVVAASITKDYQNQLRTMTLRDFVINGREMANALVTSLISRYLGDNATTDAISARLRAVCPSIYKTEDAISHKAIEMLLTARNMQNQNEKMRLLQDALKLAKQITAQVNLPILCGYFQAVHCYEGMVQLCLAAAAHRDPQGIGLQFYSSLEPQDDQQGLQAFIARRECYNVITDALTQLLATSRSHPKSPSVPKLPGPPPPLDPNMLTPAEASNYLEDTLALVLRSEDELLHVAVYSWLLDRDMTERLLKVRAGYLENYLKRSVAVHPENMASLDLLWRYYETTGNYSAAARILAKLADRHCTDVDLHQRIEYLAHAAMCLKCSEGRSTLGHEGEFLQELEEKMEVARIQLQVLEALQQKKITDDCISRLNCELLDITKLYEDFADPLDLPECKLAIVHCANHYDPTLIETLWQNIIDKEFLTVADGNPVATAASMSNKLQALGRAYAASQKYFPLAYIIKSLEQKSATCALDHAWVFTALHEIGVPFVRLLDVYDRLYKSKDPVWPSMRQPLHLLWVLSRLIGCYADNPSLVPAHERRPLGTLCLDHIATYLVDLQAMGSGACPGVDNLTAALNDVQARLERLVG